MTEPKSRLAAYRHRRDHFFAEHPHSPLDADQRARFRGLTYFPEREDLAMHLEVDESGPDVGEHIEMATTDGKTKPFVRAGRVRFAVDGEPVTLTVFRDAVQGGLFIPFRDALSGTEAYEFGRYLEPQFRPDGRLEVDLNYAYNPFCAYGEGWSCPIPPAENTLPVAIRAGEGTFRLDELDEEEA
jgi:uncharacterized protein (DUF1684 family)